VSLNCKYQTCYSCNHYNIIVTNNTKSYCNSSRWFTRSSNSYYRNTKGVIGGSVQKPTGSTNACLHPVVDGGDGAIDLIVVTWVVVVVIRVPKRHGRRVPIATGLPYGKIGICLQPTPFHVLLDEPAK
jgi:hypothetical protein